jgi:hypothetical protein
MAPSPQQSTGTNTYVEVVPLTLTSAPKFAASISASLYRRSS